MKKTIILSVLIALSATVVAQNDTVTGYKSIFGHESTVWNGVSSEIDGNYNNYVLETICDTIIDEKNYKKLKFYHVGRNYSTNERKGLVGNIFLREDTSTGEVWCRYPEEYLDRELIGTIEIPIMNLNLNVGDSTYVGFFRSYWLRRKMFYVDTVVYIDSLKHIILVDDPEDFVCKDNNTIQFIEGVGCSNLFGLIPVGDFSELLCCHKDGELVYHSNWNSAHVEGCLYRAPWDNIVNREKIKAVTVSPNPAADRVTVAAEGMERVELIDVDGTVLLRRDCRGECQIDLTGLAAGLYLVRATTPRGTTTRRLVVQ
jgi:hypothetical protein